MNRFLRTCAMALSVVIAFAACSRSTDQNDAKALAGAITGTTASKAVATSKVCELLSRAEVSAALGATVNEVADWSYGGCEWRAGDKAVQVQVAAARYWQPLARSSGGESLPGIGKAAFVGPALGGFTAGALMESRCVYVSAQTRDTSVNLLRQAVTR